MAPRNSQVHIDRGRDRGKGKKNAKCSKGPDSRNLCFGRSQKDYLASDPVIPKDSKVGQCALRKS